MVAPKVESAATRVVFRLHGIEDTPASVAAKHLIVKDIEVCDISFAGNKSTVGTFPADEVADWFDDGETGYRRERTYKEKYAAEYAAFKSGESHSMAGTPLEALNMSDGKRKELRGANVWTVEALASLDGAALKSLGMGGRDLKNQAVDFLAKAADGGATSAILSEMEAMRAEIAALKAAKPDPLDHDGDGKKGGIAPAVADNDEDPKWSTFEDDDIKAWLGEAGVDVDGRWGRKRLIEEADAVLAKQGKKAAAN